MAAPLRLRSMLFVPGDRPERMEKALGLGADALILDLEDSVSLGRKPLARAAVGEFLARPRTGVRLFVRINPLDGGLAMADVEAVAAFRPDGIVLPKAEGAASLRSLDYMLGDAGDATALILPIATETPVAMFRLGEYGGVTDRLCGLSWGAEDLPAAIGAAAAREADGRYTAPIEIARSLTLFAAHAAGVQAIDTVYPDFRDLDGLACYADRAARDGFTGMLAIHPGQIAIINRAFVPPAAAVAQAQAVVAAFAANPGAGVLSVDGKMIDAPHLKQAQRILARLDPAGQGEQ